MQQRWFGISSLVTMLACNGSSGKVSLDDMSTSIDEESGELIDTGTNVEESGVDNDGDGVSEDEGDCDDTDPNTYPGAPELCDGVDNDCDEEIDNDPTDASTYYQDLDQDGFGKDDSTYEGCEDEPPPGYASELGDCDDDNDQIHPDAEEVCDGLDNDCDGVLDNGVEEEGAVYYLDVDGDGFGDAQDSILSCIPLEGYSSESGDCDDNDSNTYPGAPELCDYVQNDCLGVESSDGLATFIPTNGTAQDITAEFTTGASQYFILDGEYHFCSGTFPANITVSATASLIGHDGAVLQGGTAGPIVQITSSSISVFIDSLNFSDGQGEEFEESNYNTTAGGIVCNAISSLSISSSTFVNNFGGRGGAMMLRFCTVDIVDSSFEGNEAEYGGGIFVDDAVVAIENSTFFSNTASAVGGGLYAGLPNATVDLTISDSDFTSNTANFGGGFGVMYTDGSFSGIIMEDNFSSIAGGGLFFAHSTISLESSVVSNGVGTGFGGGIYLYDSDIVINATSISGNSAMYGGGLVLGSDYSYYYSITELTDVTISNNNASIWGGGVYYTSGMHFLTDSTVENNNAAQKGGGVVVGDLYQDTQSNTNPTLELDTSLLSGNSSDLYGAMLSHFGASVTCSAANSETAGFTNNSSTNLIGSIFVSADSAFASQGCDFGTGTSDNLPIDLSLGKVAGGYDDYSYGDNETFICASDICGP